MQHVTSFKYQRDLHFFPKNLRIQSKMIDYGPTTGLLYIDLNVKILCQFWPYFLQKFSCVNFVFSLYLPLRFCIATEFQWRGLAENS